MKKLIIYTIIVQGICFISCSNSKKIASFPEITVALPGAGEGTITIRSSGQGETEAKAVSAAEKKAFNTLLFYGLPSSVQTRPMIENEAESKRTNSQFFDDFLENGEYKKFITKSYNYSNVQKVGKYYYLNRDVNINLRSLRAQLENKGLIRKFGY
ncbi:MAG TPA: hypothetical protein VK498_13630 [Ferruginibacter sp.]|nr:hypothetical protein [Ferruginibacter sp.]